MPQNIFALNSLGTPVCVQARLAMGLRFLAGGQIHDLVLIYGVCSGECYNSIWRFVDAVNESTHDDLQIKFPFEDEAKLIKLEAEFRSRSRKQVWRNCVGCVDGAHFPMMNPGVSVEDCLRYHVSRKDCYAHLAMAVCDADRRFLAFDITHGPTTHDSLAFAATQVISALSPVCTYVLKFSFAIAQLGLAIDAGNFPEGFFLNGDSAFVLSNCMVVPTGLAEFDDFDFEQSSNRMAIE